MVYKGKGKSKSGKLLWRSLNESESSPVRFFSLGSRSVDWHEVWRSLRGQQ